MNRPRRTCRPYVHTDENAYSMGLFGFIRTSFKLQLNSMLNGLWLVRQLSSRRDVQRKHQSARQMVYLKNEKLIYIFLLEECLPHEKGNCDEGTRCESTEQVICGIIS